MLMIKGWLNVEEINKNKNLPTGLKKTKKIRQRENLICSCKQADCYNTLFFLFKRTKKKIQQPFTIYTLQKKSKTHRITIAHSHFGSLRSSDKIFSVFRLIQDNLRLKHCSRHTRKRKRKQAISGLYSRNRRQTAAATQIE